MSELKHYAKGSTAKYHKYTRKFWSNGRWRYVYGYGGASNIIEKSADAIGVDDRVNAEQAYKDLYYDADMVNLAYKYKNDPKYKDANTQKVINDSLKYYSKNYSYSKMRSDYYVSKYNKTPLGKIENSITTAKSWLNNKFGGK